MKRIYLSSPHMGAQERALLLDAFDSNWVAPLGPHVDAFEQELAAKIGAAHAAALSSGTAALHLALLLLGVGKNDEVITSTLTFSATANAITYVGARPIFIDVDPNNWQLDANLLAEELKARAQKNDLPKAVITVDLYGQCANYQRINHICAEYDIPVIEDAAEALGATYGDKCAGTLGKIGVFSFNGNKIITTSGGGMLVADDAELVQKARFLATQAREPTPHYEHREIGYNYRMSNLLAAVGRGQLAQLDARVAARQAVNAFYRSRFAHLEGIAFMPEASYGRSNAWLTCITLDAKILRIDREQVRLGLEKHNIESRPVWKPMHMQPVFKHLPMRGGAVAEKLFEEGLCLPSGSNLSDTDKERVATHFLDLVENAP